ncbi:short chain dehydrogenase [Aureococcus anophagefferens]|uniref:Short chain dehydrogenase n=1 Tax=Aureococcus anophagefferens TaxID=44056 RepID=A0ABR1FNF7_AURAN
MGGAATKAYAVTSGVNVVITGGNRGIGKACVEQCFSKLDAASTIVLGARSVKAGEAAKAELEERLGTADRAKIVVQAVDVSDAASVAQLSSSMVNGMVSDEIKGRFLAADLTRHARLEVARVAHLARVVARDHAGLRCASVFPGIVRTDMKPPAEWGMMPLYLIKRVVAVSPLEGADSPADLNTAACPSELSRGFAGRR